MFFLPDLNRAVFFHHLTDLLRLRFYSGVLAQYDIVRLTSQLSDQLLHMFEKIRFLCKIRMIFLFVKHLIIQSIGIQQQIGNAVPPKLAEKLAIQIRESLDNVKLPESQLHRKQREVS